MPNGRARNGGRYAQSVALPAPGARHGVARQPRIRPVGLLIESDTTHAEQLSRMLREESLVPIAVSTTAAAFVLLRTWGFELVMVDCATRQHPLLGSELSQIQKATHEAGCGLLLLLGGPEDLRGVSNVAENELSRVRVAGRDREHARTAVIEVSRGAKNPLPMGSTAAFA
jgi:hypothetical protein